MPANYVLLQRIELNASAASVTFSNIPQSGYTDLKVVGSIRNTLNPNDNIYISFNSDTTGSNYSSRQIYGTGSAVGSEVNTSTQRRAGITDGSGRTANTFSNTEIYIPNYLGSSYKSYSSDSVEENNATAAVMTMVAGVWNSTAAINSIAFTTENAGYSFVQYSTFSLYGLADVNTTPAISPKASGGNIQTDGTYWYHTFLSTGTFTPLTALTCNYLVVAGGGGGGLSSPYGAGGGAGGFRTATSQSVTAQAYTVTVGAGGSAGVPGTAGSASTFNSFSASGGGLGGNDNTTGGAGGSGGGGRSSQSGSNTVNTNYGAGNAGSYSPVEGYRGSGGWMNFAVAGAGGGGGGAGAIAGDPSSGTGGNGGIGSFSAISGGSTTALGVLSGGNYYFAGGGGGSGLNTGGTGGTGGGGNGSVGTGGAPTGGTVNTGGGGGGAYGSSTAGSGGSGIVIIRYAMA
jgi:hypothetical protein